MLSKIKLNNKYISNTLRTYTSHVQEHHAKKDSHHDKHDSHHDDHGDHGHHPYVYQHPDNVPVETENVDDAYLAKKFHTVVPKTRPWYYFLAFYGRNFEKHRFDHLIGSERRLQWWWKKMKENQGEPTKLYPIIGKLQMRLFCGLLGFFFLVFPIFGYLLFFSKSEFHQKYHLFESFNVRKPPILTRPWDALKKNEDGHWYLKNERVD